MISGRFSLAMCRKSNSGIKALQQPSGVGHRPVDAALHGNSRLVGDVELQLQHNAAAGGDRLNRDNRDMGPDPVAGKDRGLQVPLPAKQQTAGSSGSRQSKKGSTSRGVNVIAYPGGSTPSAVLRSKLVEAPGDFKSVRYPQQRKLCCVGFIRQITKFELDGCPFDETSENGAFE
jgi:hypothetical protein